VIIAVSVFASWCATYRRKWFYFMKPVPVVLLTAYLVFFIFKGNFEIVFLLLLAAMIFCLLGDIMLLFDKMFMIGIISFLLGHFAFLAAFIKKSIEVPILYPILIILISMILGSYITLKMGKESRKLYLLPVCFYILVITFMVISAINRDFCLKSSFSFLSAGALCFYISDGLLSYDRFVKKIPFSGILIHLFYYGAQLLIVTGMVL
jgi:uncharacterized membrane protein YhhN